MIFFKNEGNIPPTPYLRTSRCLESVFRDNRNRNRNRIFPSILSIKYTFFSIEDN